MLLHLISIYIYIYNEIAYNIYNHYNFRWTIKNILIFLDDMLNLYFFIVSVQNKFLSHSLSEHNM